MKALSGKKLKLRNRWLLTCYALVFFIIINLQHYWIGYLVGGAWIVVFILSITIYFSLLLGLFLHIYLAIAENPKDKSRFIHISILTLVLILVFLYPTGIIRFGGEDLFVAQREGAVNCTTTFSLKKNNCFIETTVCFGIQNVKGNYRQAGDTLFFYNVEQDRSEVGYFLFAVIKNDELVRYMNTTDTAVHILWIVKR